MPIVDKEAWQMYKEAEASFWTAEEADLATDLSDYNKMTTHEQTFIKHVLAFFNGADALINDNLSANFMSDYDGRREILCFYGFQYMMENIHSECYSLMIDVIIEDEKEKAHLFNAIQTMPSVREKARWVTKWMNKERSLAERLFGFALCEGLQFSGSFCAIFWLKKRGLMPGLSFLNAMISRDEGLHCKFSAMLFQRENENGDKLDVKSAHSMVRECVIVEKRFVNESLKVSVIGMNAHEMSQYIEYVADFILRMCGFKNLYGSSNPFPWMEAISLQTKVNFFEARVGEYKKAGVGTSAEERTFSITEDF